MSKTGLKSILFALFILVIASSCSKFRKIQKSDDWRVKYEAGLAYYEKKDYFKAATLFEEILPIIKGSEEAENAQFLFAYAHYFQKQYLLSAHYFKTFYTTYSRSPKAEEALYMHAYSNYLESPFYNLDQAHTYEAVQSMQTFINKFPNSKYKDKAHEIIDQLQIKLEEKAFANAKLYHKLGRHKAAVIALDNFKKDYPDSDKKEEASFLQIETEYIYAKESIRDKQKERYQKVIEFYEEFVDNYPNSRFLKDAQDIYDNAITQLGKIKANNQAKESNEITENNDNS
jgi:outer membrane protein assembly factor BamD